MQKTRAGFCTALRPCVWLHGMFISSRFSLLANAVCFLSPSVSCEGQKKTPMISLLTKSLQLSELKMVNQKSPEDHSCHASLCALSRPLRRRWGFFKSSHSISSCYYLVIFHTNSILLFNGKISAWSSEFVTRETHPKVRVNLTVTKLFPLYDGFCQKSEIVWFLKDFAIKSFFLKHCFHLTDDSILWF